MNTKNLAFAPHTDDPSEALQRHFLVLWAWTPSGPHSCAHSAEVRGIKQEFGGKVFWHWCQG